MGSHTVTINLRAYVPRLMRVAMRLAKSECERTFSGRIKSDCIGSVRDRSCWCAPCTFRHAAMKDLADLQARNEVNAARARTRR